MTEKECSICKVVKPLDEFHRQKHGPNGRRAKCKECVSEYQKQYRQANKEEIKEYQKEYRQDNKEKKKEYASQYRQEHKEERNEYERNRRANNPVIALRENVRNMINHALKSNGGSKAGESVLQYLPYTMEELESHLESQFKPGMTWKNRSEWHIDHIYPQSKLPFDSMDHPNFLKCWALDNLQPLWAEENISKGAKIIND